MAAGSRLPHHLVRPAGVSFPGATWVPQGALSRTMSCEGKRERWEAKGRGRAVESALQP